MNIGQTTMGKKYATDFLSSHNMKSTISSLPVICLLLAFYLHLEGYTEYSKFFLFSFVYFTIQWIFYYFWPGYDIIKLILRNYIFLSVIAYITFSSDLQNYAKYSVFISIVLWVLHYLYTKTMIEWNIDRIFYDNKGKRQQIPVLQGYDLEDIFRGVGGVIIVLLLANHFDKLSTFKLLSLSASIIIIGGIMAFIPRPLADPSKDYQIRRRASESEINERQDISSGIYD